MSEFRLVIKNGIPQILCDMELPEVNVIDSLKFDDVTLENAYTCHAANQCYLEQIALKLKFQLEEFQDNFEEKWWAHNRSFAKYILEAYGDKKPTKEALSDMVLSIYSTDTSPSELEKYVEISFTQASKRGNWDLEAKGDFRSLMLKYLQTEPKWFYETLAATKRSLQYNFESVANYAKRMETKSFHMKEYKELVIARHGNIDSLTLTNKLSSYR